MRTDRNAQGPTLFCAGSPTQQYYAQGPFLIFANPASIDDPPRIAVYRCYSGTVHFIRSACVDCGVCTPDMCQP